MKTVYRRRSSFGLNLTPLIDIVFLLLVFFMLTAHFVRDESVAVELPQARSGEAVEEDVGPLVVTLDGEGKIRLGEREVAPDRLEAVLRAELQGRDNREVRLRGDRGADLGVAVQVMDAARLAGAASFDIVTERP
ncbi:ExbD/TolR family protein [Endothiovibrio diazotrophicus]